VRAALDRNVNKEMAIEALHQSISRDPLSRQECELLVNPTSREASAAQRVDQDLVSTTQQERNEDVHAEENEFEFNS